MQMNQKEYINPFSQVSEIYAQKLDDASMSGDIVLLEQLVCEIEKTLPDVDAASQFREEVHYADKNTHLINFADFPQYGIRIEQLKSAFKTLYGLFDKIAYFLNSYFELGIHERDVSFNHIWLTGFGAGKNHYEYKNILNHKENFALASLYWISRDFYDKFEDSPNPRLKRISDVRNALEHKYVKVTNGWFPARVNSEIDDLALYVTEDELSALTLELMHIVREAIICVSLCVHVEEQKNRDQLQNKLIMPMPLMEYDDEWKL